MGGHFSSTYNESVQDATQTINQQYAGTCNIQCQNVEDNTNITCLGCNINGNIEIDQTCAANGNCLFNTNQQATADVLFKANNVAATTPTAIWNSFGIDVATAKNVSRQNIVNDINQSVTQNCNVTSVNQLDNTNIFLANTNVGGSILINQQGNTQGACALNSLMSASAYATGQVDNCSATGKKASKTCSGKGGKKIGSTLIWIVVGIAVVVIFFIIAKVLGNRRKKGSVPQSASIGRTSALPPAPPSRVGSTSLPPRTTLPVVPVAQSSYAPTYTPAYGGRSALPATPIRVS